MYFIILYLLPSISPLSKKYPREVSMFSHIYNTHTQIWSCQAFFTTDHHTRNLFQLKINNSFWQLLLIDDELLGVLHASRGSYAPMTNNLSNIGFVLQLRIWWQYSKYSDIKKRLRKPRSFFDFSFIPFVFITTFIRTLQNTYKKRTPLL